MEKAESFFATCCSKRTVLTVEKHWEIKKPFFTCCHLLHGYILIRCRSYKFPIRTILSLLKSSFNEGFSCLKITSFVATQRVTSAIPILLPASSLFSCFYINKCHVPSLLQLKCFVFVEAFSLSVISLLLNVFQSPEHSCTVFVLNNFSFIILHRGIPYLVWFNQSFLIFCHLWSDSQVQHWVKSWWPLCLHKVLFWYSETSLKILSCCLSILSIFHTCPGTTLSCPLQLKKKSLVA